MLALKILGGMAFFIPGFIAVGIGVGKTSEHHTLLSFCLLFIGLVVLLLFVISYGNLVR